jgi:hypothetical protein
VQYVRFPVNGWIPVSSHLPPQRPRQTRSAGIIEYLPSLRPTHFSYFQMTQPVSLGDILDDPIRKVLLASESVRFC